MSKQMLDKNGTPCHPGDIVVVSVFDAGSIPDGEYQGIVTEAPKDQSMFTTRPGFEDADNYEQYMVVCGDNLQYKFIFTRDDIPDPTLTRMESTIGSF